MDRTQEMTELAAKLVAMLIEDRSRMARDVEQLREAVEKLQKTVEAVAAVKPGSGPEPEPMPEPELEPGQMPETDDEDSGPKFEPLAVHEPELEFIYEPVTDSGPNPDPDSEVLRPRDRQEQIDDQSEWGMFFNSDIDFSFNGDSGESIIGDLMDFKEKPSDPAWMTDIPGPRVDSVYDALTNNDRIMFIRELFGGDGEQFSLSMDRIDEAPDFGQVVKEMRMTFPDWNEASDTVYQFYMLVRRKF